MKAASFRTQGAERIWRQLFGGVHSTPCLGSGASARHQPREPKRWKWSFAVRHLRETDHLGGSPRFAIGREMREEQDEAIPT